MLNDYFKSNMLEKDLENLREEGEMIYIYNCINYFL